MERYRLCISQDVDGQPTWSYDDVAAQAADALAVQGFHGATFYSAERVWRGGRSRSTISEVLSSDDDDIAHQRIRSAALDIADRLSQREVLVTRETIHAEFIEAGIEEPTGGVPALHG